MVREIMMAIVVVVFVETAACKAGVNSSATAAAVVARRQEKHRLAGELVAETRIRDTYPVRLGGVFLRGIGDNSADQDDSSALAATLGPAGEKWIISHCDVVALDSRCVKGETFPRIRKAQKLFTGLLYTYASSIYEQPDHRGSIGVWRREMAKWELKTNSGTPVKHPDPGGHWMDCSSPQWASYWHDQAGDLARKFHADGVVAADLPTGNTFVGNDLAHVHSFSDKVDATSSFLAAVHTPDQFLVIPSSVGFDELVGRPTLPMDPKRAEPRLSGRCWDEFDKMSDGAWAEGWVHPPWADQPLRENDWETQIEAADRAGRFGDVFIACLRYSNAEELEYGLASYLLIAHHQGRVVIQPMPMTGVNTADNGMSFQVMMREYMRFQKYFDVPLGAAPQERQYINVGDGSVWRRKYSNGDVYVNSSDTRTITVNLAGPMITVTGETVSGFHLAPHSGIILTRPLQPQIADKRH